MKYEGDMLLLKIFILQRKNKILFKKIDLYTGTQFCYIFYKLSLVLSLVEISLRLFIS